MSDTKPTTDPKGALADIQALARVALESDDPVVMRRDLEMIVTITEEALQPKDGRDQFALNFWNPFPLATIKGRTVFPDVTIVLRDVCPLSGQKGLRAILLRAKWCRRHQAICHWKP